MENSSPNQHLADRIAGLVNERGEPIAQSNNETVVIKETFEPAVEPKSVSVKVATSRVAVDAKTGKILYEIDAKTGKPKKIKPTKK
jgi:hypothetical protein